MRLRIEQRRHLRLIGIRQSETKLYTLLCSVFVCTSTTSAPFGRIGFVPSRPVLRFAHSFGAANDLPPGAKAPSGPPLGQGARQTGSSRQVLAAGVPTVRRAER